MTSEIGSMQPNPYIFNIENRRKRKARLAHEIGAGARCLKCEDKCPGFQLHFWRKICQNCRCGKDDHEVEEEDEDIGRIVIGKLFERPIRTKEEEQLYSYGTDLEMINDTTGQKEKVKFDWIPPGVEQAIAKRYMEMLPPEKRPVAGSEAAKERRRQLEQQVPLYDMDESERCELLPPEELQNFLKYLDNLRTKVAGQGSVQEITPPIRKHPSPTESSSIDNQLFQMNPFGTHSEEFPPPPESWMTHDASVGTDNAHDPIGYQNLESAMNNNAPKCEYSLLQGKERDAPLTQVDESLRGNKFGLPSQEMPHSLHASTLSKSQYLPIESEFAIPGPVNLNLSPGKGVDVENSSRNPSVPSKFSVLELTFPKPFIVKSEQRSIQPGQFSSLIDGQKSPSNKHNFVGSKGKTPQLDHLQPEFRPSNLETPCPLLNLNENESITPFKGRNVPGMDGRVASSNAVQVPSAALMETIGQCRRSAVGSNVNILLPQESEVLGGKGVGRSSPKHDTVTHSLFACQYCKHSMKPGDVAVICERAGPGKYWHPKCFVCVTCKALLADLIYFYKDGQVFCGRHYTQAADIPRCKACDELIFGDSWTRADNCDWHIHHFCCFICDKPLAGNKYIPDEKEFPHCLSCYMTFKAKMCEACEDKIGPEEKRAGYNGYFYHAQPHCFCCFHCKSSLIGVRFKMVKNWVFCSQDCIVASESQIALNPNPKKKDV